MSEAWLIQIERRMTMNQQAPPQTMRERGIMNDLHRLIKEVRWLSFVVDQEETRRGNPESYEGEEVEEQRDTDWLDDMEGRLFAHQRDLPESLTGRTMVADMKLLVDKMNALRYAATIWSVWAEAPPGMEF